MDLRTKIDASGWLPIPDPELALQESKGHTIGAPRELRPQQADEAPRRDERTAAAQSCEDYGD